MRAVVQRVHSSSVNIDQVEISSIKKGLLILLGVEVEDEPEDAEWLSQKIAQMRIFGDQDQKMNLDIRDVDGEILVVSQFTLHASTKKGNRPSYIRSAKPEQASSLYDYFVKCLEPCLNKAIKTGKFGAMMDVTLINSGPVTIIIDSKNKT